MSKINKNKTKSKQSQLRANIYENQAEIKKLWKWPSQRSSRGFHERKWVKKIVFKNFLSYLWTCKNTLNKSQIWKYVLKANFETIFWEKPWTAHSYWNFTWKYSKRSVTEKLSSYVVVKASPKTIPPNHKKTWKK